MSYNLLSGSVNFEGATKGIIEDMVDTHSNQTVSGQKTITNLSSSTAHVTTRLQVGGVHATDHAVNVNGAISGSGNISGSAFYANGVLLEAGGAVSAVANGVNNRIATFSSSDALNGEENLTFNGTILDFKATSISGSGNISGSAFYGAWAGSNILGSQVQLASAKGIQDDSGLALNVAGLATATPAGGNTVIIDQGAGAKKCTVTNLMALAPISDASALGNAGRVLLDGGVGTITSNANLSFGGTPTTLSVTGEISASSNVNVGGILRADNHISASVITLASAMKNQGDEDTGLSFDTNKIDLTAAGSTMFTVDGNISPKQTTVKNGHFKVDNTGAALDFMVSSSNGFVGIGTPSPAAPLEISSSNNPQLKLTYHGSNAAQFTVAANGNLTINPNGTTTVDSALSVNGNTTLGDASGDITTINGHGVTIPNGLNFDSNTLFISSSNNRVGIGTITPAAPLEIFQAGTQLQLSYNASDNATLEVDDNGYLYITPSGGKTVIKNDLIIRDDVSNDTVVQIYDSSDDGVIAGYQNNSIKTTIHANGTSFFNGGTVAIGKETSVETLGISGSFRVDGGNVMAQLNNSQFQISSSVTLLGGGKSLLEIKSPTHENLFSVVESGIIASNIVPAAFNANLYISGAAVIGAPTAVVPDANLHSGSVSFFLDEGNHKLKFRIRYSTGAMKTGEINLT